MTARDHAMPLPPAAAARAELAELWLLERYDAVRHDLGHDFGGGQRRMEIMRRRRSLTARGVAVEAGLQNVSSAERRAAFAREAAPRIERLESETFRHGTPATERSRQAWMQVERALT